jgi:hypothetical protein
MSARVHKCLVTITRADVADPRVLDCYDDGARLITIPIEEYSVPQANGRKTMTLRAPYSWFAEVNGADHELVCRKVIDLDKFDELPWAHLPPPPQG